MRFSPTPKLLLWLALLLSWLVSSASALTSGLFTYEIYNGNDVYITDYPENATGIVTIPAEIDGNPVVQIESSTFQNCTGITEVIVSGNNTFIGLLGFEGCSSLTSITVPASHTLHSTLDGVVFNKDLTSLRVYPKGKAGGYIIPGSVTDIAWGAFEGCNKLTSITIPSGVTSIGNGAFHDCSELTSITIPDSVTSLGWSVFSGCNKLTNITLPSGLSSIPDYTFSGCSSLSTVAIPSGVTSFGNGIFYYCSSLTGITIPAAVTTIPHSTFLGCSKLTSITLPSGVTSIGNDAFMYCNQLASIHLPSGLANIGDRAFQHCDDLTSISVDAANSHYSSLNGVLFDKAQTTLMQYPPGKTGAYNIPDGVTSIGNDAFAYCNHLTSIHLPIGLANIGDRAFQHCGDLTSITIPTSVTHIGDQAFSRCSDLTNISVDSANSHYSSLNGVLFDKAQTTLMQYPSAKTGAYNIPDGVSSISTSAFNGATRLTSVTLPGSVTSLGDYAFNFCPSLTSITIPAAVNHIGDGAFQFCSSLSSTYFYGNPPASFGTNVFYGVAASHTIYYRNTAHGFTSPTWQGYAAEMIPFSFMVLGGSSIAITDYPEDATGSLVIPETLVGLPVTHLSNHAFQNCASLTSISIPGRVTSIGSGVFDACHSLTSITVAGTNTHFSSLDGVLFNKDQTTLIRFPLAKAGGYDIPDGVTNIINNAFQHCAELTRVTIPSSVTVMGDTIFQGCSNLTLTHFEGNAPTSFGSQVFDGVAANHRIYYPDAATGFSSPTWNGYPTERFRYSYVVVGGTSVTITNYPTSATGEIIIPAFIEGKPVTRIGNNAFADCSGLTRVTIPDGVTSIGNAAFQHCSNLTQVDIPESVNSIGYWAFMNCSQLTSITIPNGVTTIADSTFQFCSSLTSVIIPASVISIESFAFENCSSLIATYFAGSPSLDGINLFEGTASGHKVYYLDTSIGFNVSSWAIYSPQAINTTTYPAASWLLNAYLAYDTPLEQDLNDDGVSLLMAYALNLNPHHKLTTQLPEVVVGSSTLELKYYSGSAGVSYQVETSQDLSNWDTAGVTNSEPDGDSIRTASIQRGEETGFLRLVVTEN